MASPDGVKAARRPNQGEGSGSIPTSGLFFQFGKVDDARALVKRYHYSRRMPSNVQFVGTFHAAGGLYGDCGEAVAATVVTIPPTRWSEPVLELARLVRVEGSWVPLSRLIKLTCVYLKRMGGDLIVSFADWTQKHHGGIYQAANWNFDGLRDRCMDGLVIDGKFLPGRSCNSRYGTRSVDEVRKVLGPSFTVEPHYDEGKYLYWKAITGAGAAKAERLGLKAGAYPKPGNAPTPGGPA
jgi:hypothetical protein